MVTSHNIPSPDTVESETFWLPMLQTDVNLLGRDLVGAPNFEF